MKKLLVFILLYSAIVNAQTGITFKVEELTKPKMLLDERSYDEILKARILDAVYGKKGSNSFHPSSFDYGMVAKSKQEGKLVDLGNNPFFNGLYRAYADHRPFVLSPDMVWLLITQGFAHHVNANAEDLRKQFVDFDGKASLVVEGKDISLTNPDAKWEPIFESWNTEIGINTKNGLLQTLDADFSTTTPISKAVSRVTVIESMKSYFEFIVYYVGCGIPAITLEGTPNDWQNILIKTQKLKKYKLDWWVGEIEPLLKEFVKTSKGRPDTVFWQNMFKAHTKKGCGAPTLIDGWAVKFFPYDRDGKRLKLKQLPLDGSNLPAEMVKVDVKYIEYIPTGQKTTPLEVWAGFTGLSQNMETFALKPEFGWLVRKSNDENKILTRRIEENGSSNELRIRVKEIPQAILKLSTVSQLSISFIDSIKIPARLKQVAINNLSLTGKISAQEIKKIVEMYPQGVQINGNSYSEPLTALRASVLGKYQTPVNIKFDKLWADGDDGQHYTIYMGLIGLGQRISKNVNYLIAKWYFAHPSAKAYPISTASSYYNDLLSGRSTYCLVVDGKDTLNNYLVKEGAFPSTSMRRHSLPKKSLDQNLDIQTAGISSREVSFLIPDKSYRKYLAQLEVAEKYAKKNKLGIHAETESK